ncbi:tRNA pseudouridine(55) synthase TruB [sulfur-oxidizing endosymbiont of Gigantopelta aegis]|uniref:tRNA pseudouridine(55) synthase TruB n=1 Tax=sulfur-oxidizing endosymbiont of Gigantopelta aegis TaxID=2794934 RepID=UPI0018DDD690|nr:tRNA pseudouridine(55) synthase TruB [sulfur-oxidizing endosymbiont of Gigantopelta aegis]
MARRKKGRLVNGILVLDKPTGMSSNKALQQVKRLFFAQKAGHTGSLDPLATGVLPICLGEATKVSHYLLDSNKSYRAKCILGQVTTSGDSDGDIIGETPVPELLESDLLAILADFEGPQEQTPPMFSALKHNGRPLYEYARKGIVIERKSRPITLFSIKLLSYDLTKDSDKPFIEIEVRCSKGTYIRTLCEDIGTKIGCGAHIGALRRIDSGPFLLSQAITLDDLLTRFKPEEGLETIPEEQDYTAMDQLLLPTDTAIQNFPSIEINAAEFDKIQHGINIDFQPDSDLTKHSSDYRLYYNNILIALAIPVKNDNNEMQLKPKRLLFL